MLSLSLGGLRIYEFFPSSSLSSPWPSICWFFARPIRVTSRSSRLLSSDLGKKMLHRVLACRFFCSRLWENTLEIIYDAYYSASASSSSAFLLLSSSASDSLLCYCIFRNRKGHLDHVCDKKIACAFAFAFAFAFDIVFIHFHVVSRYYCCCCCCCRYKIHTPETNCSQTTRVVFDYRNFTYLNTLALFRVQIVDIYRETVTGKEKHWQIKSFTRFDVGCGGRVVYSI